MQKTKQIRKCPKCNKTEIVCGMCGLYDKSYTFADYGVCTRNRVVAKECGYFCLDWVCEACYTKMTDEIKEK